MNEKKKKFYTAFFISLEGKDRPENIGEDWDKMVNGKQIKMF
jgi:hypothetical protein